MKRKKILIVDDEEKIRANYCRLLQAAGKTLFDVFEASNVIEAAKILTYEEIDLVLLDIRMPGVDGRKLYEMICAARPETKVIVASVYTIDKQKEMIPEARDYYDKSQGPIGLLEKVTKCVS